MTILESSGEHSYKQTLHLLNMTFAGNHACQASGQSVLCLEAFLRDSEAADKVETFLNFPELTENHKAKPSPQAVYTKTEPIIIDWDAADDQNLTMQRNFQLQLHDTSETPYRLSRRSIVIIHSEERQARKNAQIPTSSSDIENALLQDTSKSGKSNKWSARFTIFREN